MNSTHKCEVVPIGKWDKVPNADTLSYTKIFNYDYVGKTELWVNKGIKKAIYLPPDSVVDTNRPEFEFLKPEAKSDGTYRIKAKRLKGVLSFGLLVPAPDDAKIGEDYAERLGVTHYEPAIAGQGQESGINMGGEVESGPNLYHSKYDVEAGRRYADKMFSKGDEVVVTEKLHGCNGKYVFHNGQQYCGSRTEWKREFASYDHLTIDFLAPQIIKDNEKKKDKMGWEPLSQEKANLVAEQMIFKLKRGEKKQNLWWKVLRDDQALQEFCAANPDHIIYGEVVGVQGGFNYGCEPGKPQFYAFDIMKDGKWLNSKEAFELARKHKVKWVPVLTDKGIVSADFITQKYDFDNICKMAEGKTLVSNATHVREGVVLKLAKEREYGERACLKWVGVDYLNK